MSDISPSNIPLKLLSEVVSGPVVKAYNVGGLGLVFISIGALLTLVAFYFGPGIGYVILAVGIFLILVTVCFFYFESIRPLQNAAAQIKRNKEIIDTVQTSALQLAILASNLHKLTIRHIGELTRSIVLYQQTVDDAISPVQQLAQTLRIPGAHKIGEVVNNKYVLKEKELANSILLITYGTEEVIREIQLALYRSNLKPLKEYLDQVKELNQKLQEFQIDMDKRLDIEGTGETPS